jgi:signal transduction histidine kinase
MHAILSFATFGRDRVETSKSEKLRDYFVKIHTSGTRLLGLLNDLLDLSKLEAGKMVFKFGECDLGNVVDAVAEELQLLTSDKDLAVRVTKRGSTRVAADTERMIQVMRNILDNAIKFSPEGGTIEIDISEGNGEVAVSVSDTGSGIQETELETIFDAFVQSGSVKSNSGGTGLGLAICKDIIKAHQGRIWAESNPDGGVFRFTLPCKLTAHGDSGSQLAA